MFHDDVYEHLWKTLKPMTKLLDLSNEELRRNFDEFDGGPMTNGIVLESVYKWAFPIFYNKPVPFYFKYEDDAMHLDPAMLETAKEFFHAGILKLPHNEIMLIVEFGTKKLPLVAMEVEAANMMVVIPLMHTASNPDEPVLLYAIIAERGKEKSLRIINFMKDHHAEEQPAKLLDAFLYFILLMSMPHYDKEKISVSDKVNRKREKSGKAPYRGYTKIYLNKKIRESLAQGGGWTVRPHWRRGHIRTLSTGKLIPVRPTMVNWDGEANLEKNVYIVENERNADAK